MGQRSSFFKEISMNLTTAQEVRYQAADMVIAVCCQDEAQAKAVRTFAAANGFACPAPQAAKPMHFATAKTHGNGEVRWG
jgi:hypothetical protein